MMDLVASSKAGTRRDFPHAIRVIDHTHITSRAIVYAYSDARCLPEAVRSTHSCRAQMPTLPRLLYLACGIPAQQTHAAFTQVRRLTHITHARRPKFDAMLDCDFDSAIFVDGDTWFADTIEEVFDTLTYFDVALVPAPVYLKPVPEAAGVCDQLEVAIPE